MKQAQKKLGNKTNYTKLRCSPDSLPGMGSMYEGSW